MQKLELLNLSKNFSGFKALSDVNIELLSGETHALMGENGARKTTLIKIVVFWNDKYNTTTITLVLQDSLRLKGWKLFSINLMFLIVEVEIYSLWTKWSYILVWA